MHFNVLETKGHGIFGYEPRSVNMGFSTIFDANTELVSKKGLRKLKRKLKRKRVHRRTKRPSILDNLPDNRPFGTPNWRRDRWGPYLGKTTTKKPPNRHSYRDQYKHHNRQRYRDSDENENKNGNRNRIHPDDLREWEEDENHEFAPPPGIRPHRRQRPPDSEENTEENDPPNREWFGII